MKTKLLVLLLVFLGWSCKENPGTVKPNVEEVKQETKAILEVSPIIKSLAKFADLTLADTTNVNTLFLFKEIDANGVFTEIDMENAVALYRKLSKREQGTSLPIFELKNTDMVIFPLQGTGFGGAIWAKVLVDKKTLEIKKVGFEHKAESEGYGDAMTQTSFENQFISTKINLEQHTFNLQKQIEKMKDDGQIIDGISGATMTSQGVVQMMNEGLRKYSNYLKG